ncbi:MAG: putative Ig domain-containing protein [Gammaproteobacteria bacterium]|nr:putative Ig domain-containing protein [Gammaproteobacteria bacterium]
MTLSYQWKADGSNISGATSSTYVLTTNEAHKTITLDVLGTDSYTATTGTSTTAGVAVANAAPVNTVLPVISGTAAVGNALSSTTGTWADADGDTSTYSYQWKADGTDISGATSSSYTLTTAEAHKTITVTVTADDGNSGSTAATSTGIAVANAAPVNTGIPVISGTAAVGGTLNSTAGIWTDADGDTPTYSYQWSRADDGSGTNLAAIAGATASSYTLVTADALKNLRIVVTADDGNGSADQTGISTYIAVTNAAPVNTVLPVISGTAAVGSALSSTTGTWTDADGDTPVYSYQWKADGTDISGATSSSYTLTTAEAHKTITVTVTADDGNSGSTAATSTGTAVANAAPVNTGVPVISGTAAVGSALSSTTGIWTDADGDTPTYSYQWKADGTDISGATSSSYTLTTAEAHKTITVTVTADDGNGGNTAATSTGTAVANAAPVNTGVPVISGTAAVGSALSSTTGIWTDADGDTTTYSYQWKVDGTSISGATSSNYTLATAEAHKTITVTVTANDGNGGSVAATSTGTAVANAAPVNTVLPVISGTAAVGNALSSTAGTWTDADGDTPTYSYQWKADGTDISGATSSSYTLTTAEAHKTITVTVTADDGNSGSTAATSTGTAVANAAPVNTGVPVISGTAAVGGTLNSTAGIWTDADGDTPTYSYQWSRADDGSGTNLAAIAGATASSYTLVTADALKNLRIVVTADDGNGSADQAGISTYIVVTNAAPVNTVLPVISGTAAVGSTLSSATGTWTDADGDTPTYSYQWKVDGTNIVGATSSSYTLTTAEAHKAITVTVTADDGNGGNTAATSTGTAVANAAPVNTGVPVISGTAAVGNALSSTTGAWTDADGDTSTYSYQWKADGTNIVGATSSSYTLTTGEAHQTITVTVTANDGNSGSTAATSTGTAVANAAPVNAGVPVISGTVAVGNALNSTTGTWTDADGDTPVYSYQWKADGSNISGASSSSYTLTTADASKAITVAVTANDGNGGSMVASSSAVTAANSAPNITSTAVTSVNEDSAYNYTFTATDNEGDTLILSAPTLPGWMSFNAGTGVLSGTPTNVDVGTHSVVLRVNDGTVNVDQSFSVAVANTADAPVISSTAVTSATEDTTYSYIFVASDVDVGDTLTLSAPTLPGWLNFNAGTGLLSGTPTNSEVGNHNVVLRVNDGTVDVGQSFTIIVANINDAPVLSGSYAFPGTTEDADSIGVQVATVLSDAGVSASDDDGNTLGMAVTAVSGNGSGQYSTDSTDGVDGTWTSLGARTGDQALLLSETAWLRYQPDQANGETVGLSFRAWDQSVGTEEDVVDSTINGVNTAYSINTLAATLIVSDVNDAAIISSTAITAVNEDSAYSYTFVASDVDTADTLTYSAPTLPAWMSFNATTGVLSGTPANGDVGNTSVVLRVNDGSMNVDQAFMLTVINTNDAPVISGTPTTRVVEGQTYSFTPSATDVDAGDSLSFVITNKPGWASFETSTGALTGTPAITNIGTTTGVVLGVNDGISTSNLPTFFITVVGDLDGDTVGDDVDTDIDGDGMDNAFENANGLDPRNAADAALDSDNDGLDNLSEYQQGLNPTVDDNPPVLMASADVVIDATGLRTLVNLGAASAVDALDGTLTAVADQSGYFVPGRHVVTWNAQDAAGNTGTAQQVVDVRPLAQFSKDQKLVEGVTATLRVYLNGVAPAYPVEIPYSVTGSATQPDDFVLADGVLVITAGTEAELSIDIIDDGMDNEPGETIEIVMGRPTNAAVGSHATHTMTLVEGNLAPIVSLNAMQGTAVTVVTQDGGTVVVSATMTDPNPDDSHSYDWSGSDNALVDTDTTDTIFSFDPSGVPEGVYTVSLQVTDDGMPVMNGEGLLRLRVIATAPALNAGLDSDGDGVMDADEGNGDEDNDGVSDYVDAISASNVLQGITGASDSFLIETEAGLQIRLGSAAFTTGNNAAQVTDSANDEVTNIGGIFDIEITGLSTAGQALQVILPQVQPIPANAVYREQLPSGWIDFEQDSDNILSSAAGAEGQCPAPGDAAFEPGLVEGYWCVQLKIQDGGPNDGDGQINNAVVSFGGVAQKNTTSVSTRGGGSISLISLMLLILLALVCLGRLQATGQGRLLARVALFAPVILVAGLLPDTVQASDKLLVGVSYLRANGPESSGEFNRELVASGLQATVTQTSLSRNGGRIFIRYQESEQLAIELAYVDLGDVTTKITGLNSSVSTFLTSLSDVFPSTANGWSLRVTPRYAIGKNIDLVAALGLFRWRADYTLKAPTQKKRFHLDGIDLSYGLAIEHRLTDKLQPHLGWQAYQVGDKVIHTLDLGIAYWF